MCDLEGPQQPFAKQFVRRQAGDILTIQINLARSWCVMSGNHVEQRGLARAVWSDQSGNRALRDFNAGPVDRFDPAEMHMQVINLDHIHCPLNAKKQPEIHRAALFYCKNRLTVALCYERAVNDFVLLVRTGCFTWAD